MKKGIIVLFTILTVTCLFTEIVDWGVNFGYGKSFNFGRDDLYNLEYIIKENFSIIDTTIVPNETISFNPIVGKYFLTSFGSKTNMDIDFLTGLYLTYQISKDRNSLNIQPEIYWNRISLEYSFEGQNQQTYSYSGEYEYMFSDSTEHTYSYNGETLINVLNNATPVGSVKSVINYIKIPILIKIQREFEIKEVTNKGFLYFGPSFGLKISHTKTYFDGSDDIEKYLKVYCNNTLYDVDSLTSCSYSKIINSIDEVKSLNFDFIFGIGWKFQNVFGVGLGKDSLILDLRNQIGLTNISNTTLNDRIKFYSFFITFGYEF